MGPTDRDEHKAILRISVNGFSATWSWLAEVVLVRTTSFSAKIVESSQFSISKTERFFKDGRHCEPEE